MKTTGFTWSEEYRARYFSSEKVQQNQAAFIARASLPKPPEQRAKMAAAKSGRKFTAEHRANMSESHKFRQAIKREILATTPDLPPKELWDLVRMRMEQADAAE